MGSLAARESLIRDFSRLLSIHEVQGRACAQKMDPEVLKYMGTTYIARDIEYITTVLEGKGAMM